MASRIRSSKKYAEVLEIGNKAKANLDRLRSELIIRHLPENVPEDVFYPKHSNEGANYCVICGRQGEYRLSTHLERAHKELVKKESDEFKIIMQLGRGIVQYMGRAKIHLSDVRRPITTGEWNIYHDFVQQLRKCGIPTDGGYEDTRIDRYKYVRRDEVEMMVDEAFNARRREAGVREGTSSLAQSQGHLQAEEGSQPHFKDNVHPIESIGTASFTLIKPKVKRGDPSVVMASPRLKADVGWMPGASQIRKISVSSEEESVEPPELPPTFQAPLVARHLLYESFGDVHYTGGSNVVDIFKKKPEFQYMFCHEFDTYDPKYFTQDYKISQKNSKALQLDKKLKFWRKVVRKSHPLLEQFEQYILKKMPEATKYAGKPFKEGIYNYIQCIDRFMLIAMRSRQRLGQTITVDDAIYAGEIIESYMDRLKQEGVKLALRQLILRSLSSFERFLAFGLEKRAGATRQKDLEKYFRLKVYHQWSLLKTETKGTSSLTGIVPRERREALLYCVTRAVVDHKEVDKAVENLMDKFEHDGTLNPAQFNYLMGALFAYIVHCNTSRDEVIYKMMYGSIKAAEAKTRAASEFAQDTDLTGLKNIEVEWENKKEELWIGSYPYPKVASSYHKTPYGGQYFVLDKKSKKWIDYYLKLRDFVIQMHHLVDMMKPDAPFFLQYKGDPISRYNVSHIIKQFLRDSGFTELNISCMGTRHAIASGQYEDFYRRKCEQLDVADEDMSRLSSHSKRTRLASYQDSYKISCAYGYLKVRQVAQRQEAQNQDVVKRARNMFKLVDLESRRKIAVPDLVADELELEDFDDNVSLPSDKEEDLTNVLEEQPGPSSQINPRRQRLASPSAVEESPKKRPKKSNVEKEPGGKRSKAQSKKSKKRSRLVIASSDESEL